NTRIQQVSEMPPASRAAIGGGGKWVHFWTPRPLRESKNSKFIPATPKTNNFVFNLGGGEKATPLLMNSSRPVPTATRQAAKLHPSSGRATSVNERRIEAIPSRRRSTIAIVPITAEMATTCSTSMVVKSHFA